MRIESTKHIADLSDLTSLEAWNHKVLVACGHKPLAMSLATCLALESAGGTNHLLGVCTQQATPWHCWRANHSRCW